MKKSILTLVLAALCLIFNATAQQNSINISSTVINENGDPVPNITIKIKNTKIITTSDEKGKFNIKYIPTKSVIILSGIGYNTTELDVSEIGITGKIILKSSNTELIEVEVNAGYYTVKDKERTGSISRIEAKTIQQQPVSNPLAALIGRMPGVQIQQTTGFTGGNFNINIRGKNSLRNEGNAPLYLIDGVPIPSTSIGSIAGGNITGGGDPLSGLSPNDIANIEVLKDADATAIYGSRGANGVVLISTKKGKAGRTTLDLNIYQGISKVPHFIKLLNTSQYLEMRNEALINDNQVQQETDYDLNGTWDKNRFTDWQKQLIGETAKTSDIQMSISGGHENTHFLLKGTKHRETTVLPTSDEDHKYTTLFNLDHHSRDQKFNINLSTSYTVDNNKLPQYDPTYAAITLPPNAPTAFDNQGNLNWQKGTWDNPFAGFKSSYFSQTKTLIANTQLSYQIFQNLRLKTNLGYTANYLDERTSNPIEFYNPNLGITTGDALFASSKLNTWIVEPQLEYHKQIGSGKLTGLVGLTLQQNQLDAQTISATGYSSDTMLDNLKAASEITVSSLTQTLYKYQAIFGRINYDLYGKYLVNLTGRRDGSSRFGPGKQFANFGAIGAAWIFSEENLIKYAIPVLSYGKLRASYGITGSDQIGDYGYYDIWNNTTYHYGNSNGLYPTTLFNPDYSWEKNQKLETAIELSFFDQRISTTLSYYNNRSGNQLVGFPLSGTTGFGYLLSNMHAVVQNSGFEFCLNTKNIQTKAFQWSSDFNISIPKNKLISFPNLENTAYALKLEVGKSIYLERGYKYLGIDPVNGNYLFEDKNNDGAYDPVNDYQSLVENRQKYYGGLQNNFQYHNWDLTVFFQFVKQTGNSYLQSFVTPGFLGNQPALVMSRWPNGIDAQALQKYTQTLSDGYLAYEYYLKNSDRKLSDASYIRLKNISISYSLPMEMTNKIKIQKARIYFQGQNLFTFTRYPGLDPETQNAALPPLRSLTMGIQITF